jgi:hypothetical protein
MPLLEEQAEKLKAIAAVHHATRTNDDKKTRKNLREIGAGVYYTHSKRSYQWVRHYSPKI